MVRRRLLDVMEDRLPYETYAVKKTLRKSMKDCCFPMRPAQVQEIRRQLYRGKPADAQRHPEQLTYAEEDQAIYFLDALPKDISLPVARMVMGRRVPGRIPYIYTYRILYVLYVLYTRSPPYTGAGVRIGGAFLYVRLYVPRTYICTLNRPEPT
jgi:hypothetical protein